MHEVEGLHHLHLQAWDAGWYQLRMVWKHDQQRFKGAINEWKELRQALHRRMLPMVYRLQMLPEDVIF